MIRRFDSQSVSEIALMQQRQVTYLLNLAAATLESRQWSRCIEACTTAIALDPHCAKAFHRRGKARTLPFSSGTVEHQMALQDFIQAMELDPEEKRYQQDCHALRAQLTKQQLKDKKAFGNFFERAKYLDEEESLLLQKQQEQKEKVNHSNENANLRIPSSDSQETLTKDQLRHILLDIDQSIEQTELALKYALLKQSRLLLERERLQLPEQTSEYLREKESEDPSSKDIALKITMVEDEVKELKYSLNNWQEKKQSLHHVLYRAIAEQGQFEQRAGSITEAKPSNVSSNQATSVFDDQSSPLVRLKDVDFANPSPELILDAKKHGVDVTDPVIQQILVRRQRQNQLNSKGTAGNKATVEDKTEEERVVLDAFDQEAREIADKIVGDSGEFSMRLMLFTRCTYGIGQLCSSQTFATHSAETLRSSREGAVMQFYRENPVVQAMMRKVQQILQTAHSNTDNEMTLKQENSLNYGEKWLLTSCKQQETWFEALRNWTIGIFIDSGPPKSTWEFEHDAPLTALALALEAQDVRHLSQEPEEATPSEPKQKEAVSYDASGVARVRLLSFEEVEDLLTEMLTMDFAYCYRRFQSYANELKSSLDPLSMHDEQELWSRCLEAALSCYYHAFWESEDFEAQLVTSTSKMATRKKTKKRQNNSELIFSLSSWPQTFLRYSRRASAFGLPLPHRDGNQREHVLSPSSSSSSIPSQVSSKKNFQKHATGATITTKEHRWFHQIRLEKIVVVCVVLTWMLLLLYFLQSNLFPPFERNLQIGGRKLPSSSELSGINPLDVSASPSSNDRLINENNDEFVYL